MNNIKKGNLNYDQTGRAYPDNSEIKENWDCIWENEGKYYKIIGLPNHAEWEEVWVKNKEKYNQIIDEAYENYKTKTEVMMGHGFHGTLLLQEEFINKCKTDNDFSKTWELKIDEREYTLDNGDFIKEINVYHIPKKSMEYLETKFVILQTGNIKNE
jgi:hypothetical protein